MPPSSVCYHVPMRLTIETTARLPYGLVPSPDYTPGMLSGLMASWAGFLAGDIARGHNCIVVRPDEGEARKAGCEDEINMSRVIEFRDIRSILVEAK